MTEISSTATEPVPTGTPETVHYDTSDGEPLSVAIALAVADATDTDVTELEPLHYTINADALDRLFEPRVNGHRAGGSVTFAYSGCEVTVNAGGSIDVSP